MMLVVEPRLRHITMRVEFITPVSHHDPVRATRANLVTFRRTKRLIPRARVAFPDQHTIHALTRRYPIPAELAEMVTTSGMSASDFLAVVIMAQYIARHNGQGLMDGMKRYEHLASRTSHLAIAAATLSEFWSRLCHEMQAIEGNMDQDLMALLLMPQALASTVLERLAENTSAAVGFARVWLEMAGPDVQHEALALDEADTGAEFITVEVPSFSANSVRHEMVREPGMWHLLNALGLDMRELPDGIAALLYNGGDLNASGERNQFKYIRQIRAAYPILGLLGGAVSKFILGASNLEVSAWPICREYNDALSPYGVEAEVSAFDLLDQQELTRHSAGRINGSPMPVGFETLAAGTQLLIDMRVRPYATDLEIGALAAALETYQNADSTLGGQAARGYGLCRVVELLRVPDGMAEYQMEYESYLSANKDGLAAGLMDGTLTTGAVQI